MLFVLKSLQVVVLTAGFGGSLKAPPAVLFDGRVRIFTEVKEEKFWPLGRLYAYITMISEVDGDATFLGLLCVLHGVYRQWASAELSYFW